MYLFAEIFCQKDFLFTFTPYENCPNQINTTAGSYLSPSRVLRSAQRSAAAYAAAAAWAADRRRSGIPNGRLLDIWSLQSLPIQF